MFLGLIPHMLFCYWRNLSWSLFTLSLLFFVKVKNLRHGIYYLVCAAHHFNAVHLSYFPSLPTFLFYNVPRSEASGRTRWRKHLWVSGALRIHWSYYQQTRTSSSMFSSEHCVADTVCPFNWWGWQCQTQMNRFKSTNFPSRGCSSFLEICHWGIFWLNLSRHLLFTDIAFLTGGITEVVLRWQYPLALCQSDSSSIPL